MVPWRCAILRSEAGSAAIDFIFAACAGIAIAGALAAVTVVGYTRVNALDALAQATRIAMLADNAVASDPRSLIEQELSGSFANWPFKVQLLSVEVVPWSTPNSGANLPAGGIIATARYSTFGLQGLGFTQEVTARVASELN